MNARTDWDYFTRIAIVDRLNSLDVRSEADCKKWVSFMSDLARENSDVWMALLSFSRAVDQVQIARMWANIADIGGS